MGNGTNTIIGLIGAVLFATGCFGMVLQYDNGIYIIAGVASGVFSIILLILAGWFLRQHIRERRKKAFSGERFHP